MSVAEIHIQVAGGCGGITGACDDNAQLGVFVSLDVLDSKKYLGRAIGFSHNAIELVPNIGVGLLSLRSTVLQNTMHSGLQFLDGVCCRSTQERTCKSENKVNNSSNCAVCMVADLSDFTDQKRDAEGKTGPSLKLYTAGSGGGEWAYVVKGSGSPARKREPYSGDTKGGFIPQLKAVTEGIAFLDDEHPNAEVTIFTPSEPIVGLVEGETDPDDSYRDLYRKANTNYNKHRSRWSIKHLGGDRDNPAQDLL